MQHRKPFRWGKDKHRMFRKGKKMGLYVSEILLNAFEKLMIKMFQENFYNL